MKELELQLDGGQLDGYYNEYQVQLVDEDDKSVVLAAITATPSSMGEAPPSIGGVPMAPDTEYWIVLKSAVSKLGTATQLRVIFLGSSALSINVDIEESAVYTASEEADWTGIGAVTFPVAAATFGVDTGDTKGQGPLRGVGFDTATDGTVLTRVGWCQTGQSNLTPADLRSVTLRANGSGTQSGDYAAVSRLVPLQT